MSAKWINGKCSNCGAEVATNTAFAYLPPENQHFCYNCGAVMNAKGFEGITTTYSNGNGEYELKPMKFEGDTIINGGEY